MQIFKISDMIAHNPYNLNLTDTDGATLISTNQILSILSEWSEWYFVGDFEAKYAVYVAIAWDNALKAYKALSIDYNPINNYDMTESSIDNKSQGETIYTKTQQPDSKNVETHTMTGTTTTERYTTTYDDQSPRMEGYSEQYSGSYNNPSQSTETTTTQLGENYQATETHNEITITHEGQQITGDDITTHKLSRSGNIGVTTSQQMITSEIELRKHDIVRDFIKTFVARNAFYVGVGCDDIEVIKYDN